MYKKTQLVAGIILLTILPQVEAARLKTKVKACSIIQADSERLACFDGLLAEESPKSPEAPIATTSNNTPTRAEQSPQKIAADQAPQKITDEVGLERPPPPKETKIESYAVVITSCESSRSAKRLFRLDNGQVWQQKNDKYVSPRHCKTEGIISKDFFGYQLLLNSNDQSFRVSRIR